MEMSNLLRTLLKKSRLEMGISAEEMANLINVSLPVYRFLEYGDPLWSTKELERKVEQIVEQYRKSNSTN